MFKNLGFVIIDEQHKFGVRQRIELSNKGGKNCDVITYVSYTDTTYIDAINLWRYGCI